MLRPSSKYKLDYFVLLKKMAESLKHLSSLPGNY